MTVCFCKIWKLVFALMAIAIGANGVYVPDLDPDWPLSISKDLKTQYDALGRVKKSYRPSNNYEEYGYDALGNRTHFWNAEFKPTTFGVDAQGRVTSITNAIGKVTSFTFDDAGNLFSRRDAEGAETFYGYDALNRLMTVTNEGVQVAVFDHDNNGNIVAHASPLASCTFGYDSMNRLLASTSSVASATSVVNYSYDLNGNRTNIVYPGGFHVGYVYGADNRLETVQISAPFAASRDISFSYDTANRLDGISYPNGVNSTFGHDAEGRITSIVHGSFIDRTIQRNALGFKETELIDAGLKPTAPDTHRSIKTHNDTDQLTSEWVQQGSNEYTVSYSYSANGCLTNQQSEIGNRQYQYDYDNRIVSAGGSGSVPTEYLYDASGARIGRIVEATPSSLSTNYFVVDYADGLKRPLAETDSNGTVTRYYVWAGSRLLCHIESDGTVRYYHADELGSTLALTDDTGAATDQFAYMPYGYAVHQPTTPNAPCPTPYLWLGGYGVYFDSDSELHLTLHRAYSSSLKRFIQADPLGIDGGVNVYAWANLNPLAFVDPYGLCADQPWYDNDLFPGSSWADVGMYASDGARGLLMSPINLAKGIYGSIQGIAAYAGSMTGDPSGTWDATASTIQNLPTTVPAALNDWANDPYAIGSTVGEIGIGFGAAKVIQAARAPKSTAYRAVDPKFAQSTIDDGFYRSGAAGRLGNDGIYANSSVKGAVAEFQYHNPGVKPTVFEVNYPAGSTLNVSPPAGNFYIESPLPFTQGANVLTAPSLRQSGTMNYLIRSGATPGRIVQ